MAAEFTQEAIQRFLTERGGRVKNLELIDHFKLIFPNDHQQKTVVRETFKRYVDTIAFVKVENGLKFVCLKKKYRRSVGNEPTCPGTGQLTMTVQEISTPAGHSNRLTCQQHHGSMSGQTSQSDGEARGAACCCECEENIPFSGENIPVSGYGNDSEVKARTVPLGTISSENTNEKNDSSVFTCNLIEVLNTANENEMGNRGSSKSEVCVTEPAPDIPKITVIEASPLPVISDGSMFDLPEHQCGYTDSGKHICEQVETSNKLDPKGQVKSQVESDSVPDGAQKENYVDQSLENKETRHLDSTGTPHSNLQGHLSVDGADEGHLDLHSLSEEEEGSTPRASRQNFIELMMNSSPQVRRDMVNRSSSYLSTRGRDLSRSDSDSVSLVSSNADEDGLAVTLDPLEHEWMLCASNGEWESLHSLLTAEPTLILKKDFVTGFNCLHWAAKQGKSELLALMVNFAKQHAVPINVNAKSSAGYTPLHLAAMHNHMEVVKLLVGAYDADVEVRDYSGKKAGQYLKNGATVDIRDIIGAYGDSDSEEDAVDGEDGVRWRLSKVLHSNLKPFRLPGHGESDSGAAEGRQRHKPLRRMSSLSHMKPKLQRFRLRTSQIFHSTSFGETSDLKRGGSFKSRPKSNLLG